jgi:hypothetical protein
MLSLVFFVLYMNIYERMYACICLHHFHRLLDIVGYSTSAATQHRRLLNIVGYSTSSVTQHRRLLDLVNLVHNRNKETNEENPGLLGLVRD